MHIVPNELNCERIAEGIFVLIPWNPKGKWIIFSKQFFLFAALKGLI
jgi:hypothetical protein